MDEAVAGHATRIEVELGADNWVTVRDNGRGIPVDPHPKFKSKSALEVILTTLHSGGKFGGKVYATSGGLHGVGISVVNALSDRLNVEVARDREAWTQNYSRGKPADQAQERAGAAPNRRGTTVTFHPDPQIFGEAAFEPERLYRMARSKAYLFRGVEIRWRCDPALLTRRRHDAGAGDVFHFPGGLLDFLTASARAAGRPSRAAPFARRGARSPTSSGRVEWAIAWPADGEGFLRSYCNTVPTPEGGTHETALRSGAGARAQGLWRADRQPQGRRRSPPRTSPAAPACCSRSSSSEPQFQGQTKEKLASPEATRLVEPVDQATISTTGCPATRRRRKRPARARRRARRGAAAPPPGPRGASARRATRKLRLPGKLADCARERRARHRDLPGRGRFGRRLGQAGAQPRDPGDAAAARQDPQRRQRLGRQAQRQPGDGRPHPGAGLRHARQLSTRTKLRYERVIIMTDADVDGAHIASLLMTFFYREMPELIENGHLFLAHAAALPPDARGARASMPATTRTRTSCCKSAQRPRQGRDQPLQGPGRDAGRAAARDHDGPGQAHPAQGRWCAKRSTTPSARPAAPPPTWSSA